jgi:diguanylate cyclase (GGDEF)-like protein
LLRRVAAILNANLETIVRNWVVALRNTSATVVHDQMLSSEIVDGMKAILAQLATTINQGVASTATGARAAEVAEAISRRHRLVETTRGTTAARAPTGPVPVPTILMPPAEAKTAADQDGVMPDSAHRRLFQTAGHAPQGAEPVGVALRQALMRAEEKGRLRQSQGYQINEVVQEYVLLRQEFWKALSAQMRRSDQPAIQLGIYINGILDDLLVATVQAYQEAAVADLEKRAIHDRLTGLYNHDYCHARLYEEIRRAQRRESRLTLIMFDLDYLKRINDTYGHQAGDRILAHVAGAMREVARESDVLCRYGGDEFVVLLPDSDRVQGELVAERLRGVVRGPVFVGRPLVTSATEATAGAPSDVFVTISAGIATYPEDTRQAETLIAQADAALYRAKAAGRDRVA